MFSLASDWIRWWRNFSWPITERRKAILDNLVRAWRLTFRALALRQSDRTLNDNATLDCYAYSTRNFSKWNDSLSDRLNSPSTLILLSFLHDARHLNAASDKNGEFMIETFFNVRHSDVNAFNIRKKWRQFCTYQKKKIWIVCTSNVQFKYLYTLVPQSWQLIQNNRCQSTTTHGNIFVAFLCYLKLFWTKLGRILSGFAGAFCQLS